MNCFLFPVTMITLDFLASGVYLFNGDIRNACYWAFAGGLSICVVLA